MKPLFTFLITILFLTGCGQSDHQHSHDDDHHHADDDHSDAEGDHHHAEGDSDGHDHDAKPEAPTSVRMGTGLMTFDTVPGWGLTADGKSAIGPTHGGVIVGKDGTIYTSADKGVIAFSPDGKVAREFIGEPYTNLHDIEIRDEDGTEYLYGARNKNAEGIKFNAADGKVALRLPAEHPGDEGRLKRLSALLGRDFEANALLIDQERDGVRLSGYAGLPTYSRGNAAHQYLFVNGRPVKDRLLQGALRGRGGVVTRAWWPGWGLTPAGCRGPRAGSPPCRAGTAPPPAIDNSTWCQLRVLRIRSTPARAPI